LKKRSRGLFILSSNVTRSRVPSTVIVEGQKRPEDYRLNLQRQTVLSGASIKDSTEFPAKWNLFQPNEIAVQSEARARGNMTDAEEIRERNDIAASLKGDGEAYRRLVVQYQNLIAGQMRRFSQDPLVLEELVQEVFVEAYLSLKSFRGKAPFLHWLRTLATRTGYRYWKSQARRRRQEAELPDNLPELPADPDAFDRFEAEDMLFHLLAKLAPDERLVLTLFYFDDCETHEIAAQTGWTRAAVKVRLHRARNRLKEFLKDKEYENV
jgi:RNA polymerase sigma-70 factor (ECF subfamily)